MYARRTITALALSLVLVIVAGDANGQYSVSYLSEIDAEGAQPNSSWGQGTTLFAEIPVQSWSSARQRILASYCVASEWRAEFEWGTYDLWSSCGDSTRDAAYIFDYKSSSERGRWGMYFITMPLEVAVGEKIGIAPGAEVIAFNSVSLSGGITDSDFAPFSHQSALRRLLAKTTELVDSRAGRAVLWVESYFRDNYNQHALALPRSSFLAGSNECREWDREATAYIEQLYRHGVVLVAGAGLDTDNHEGFQRYPACLPEVIAVTSYDSGSDQYGFSVLDHGASLAAPAGVVYGEQVIYTSSFATARVVGAALRVLEINPLLSPRELREILESTGLPVGEHMGIESFLVQVEAAAELAASLVSSEDAPEVPVQESVLNVYPNPYTGGLLHVEEEGALPPAPQEITIYNLLGREVEKVRTGEPFVLNVPTSGVYVLRSESGATKLLTVVR